MNSQEVHREKKLDWLVWLLTISIGSHYMYFKEHKFKGFIPNKKLKQNIEKKPLILPIMMYYNLHFQTIDG